MKTFFALAALVLFSCIPPGSSSKAPKTPQEVLRAVEKMNLKSLYTSDAIVPNVNIVLVVPGGPQFKPPSLGNTIQNTAYARVMVKQEQMIRTEKKQIPTDRFISDQEAREMNIYSAAMLYTLAKDFRAKGHKVSLYSRSFGSFIVPEMLRHYGDGPFTKIFIAVGRLDMQIEMVNSVAKGESRKFREDGKTVDSKFIRPDDVVNKIKNISGFCKLATDPSVSGKKKQLANIAKATCTGNAVDPQKVTAFKFQLRSSMMLQANIAGNRYTELLQGKNLGKITYYFGGKDKNVGRLSNAEVRFLTGRTGFDIDSPSGAGYTATSFTQGGSNHTMHTITGVSGKYATVKYDLEAGHFPLQEQTTRDIVAAF